MANRIYSHGRACCICGEAIVQRQDESNRDYRKRKTCAVATCRLASIVNTRRKKAQAQRYTGVPLHIVPLGCDLHSLIDPEDAPMVRQFIWYPHRSKNGHVYAEKRHGRGRLSLHRFLLNPQEGVLVDHVNGDALDNRRVNIRLATVSQNNQNGHIRADNKTGFRGVTLHAANRKFTASIKNNGIRQHLGYFLTAEEAARAYDAKARELFGAFARLNFPEEGEQSALH